VFNLKIEFSREEDGRYSGAAGSHRLRGARKQALASAEALARREIADRLEHGEAIPGQMTVSFAA
jgi:hypothetical protein